MIDVKELLQELDTQIDNNIPFSPVEVATYLQKIDRHLEIYTKQIEHLAHNYRLKLLSSRKEHKTKADAEIQAQASDEYQLWQIAKLEKEDLDRRRSDLKYYQRAIEKEWIYSN